MSRVRPRAWWWFGFVGLMLVLFGVTDIAGGPNADPGIAQGLTGRTLAELHAQPGDGYGLFDFTTRTQGWNLLFIGILLLAVVVVPYRAGEAWAWRTMWLVPVWSLGVTASFLLAGTDPSMPPPPPMVSSPFLAAIGAVVLLVERRRFFGAAPRMAVAEA